MDFNRSPWCEFPAMEICTMRISGYGNLHLQGSPLSGSLEGPPKQSGPCVPARSDGKQSCNTAWYSPVWRSGEVSSTPASYLYHIGKPLKGTTPRGPLEMHISIAGNSHRANFHSRKFAPSRSIRIHQNPSKSIKIHQNQSN